MASKEPNFEESLGRLEGLVQEMESGELPLEDILRRYEEGNRLIKFCASKLNEAEKRIEVLMKEKDGSLGLQPVDLEAAEAEDPVGRGPKPGKKARSEPAEEEEKEGLF